MVAKIVKVFPMNKRDYTDRQGQQQVFKSKGFVLHDGRSSYYAEAVQETAESIDALPLKDGDVVSVHMTCAAREYKTSADVVRYSNEYTISNMMML